MQFDLALYFNSESEERILALRNFEPQDAPPLHSLRPHLTLSIFENTNPDKARSLVEELSQDLLVLEVSFVALNLLGAQQLSACLSPALSEELISTHRKCYKLIKREGGSVSEHYRPGNWLPHCSLVKEMNRKQAGSYVEQFGFSDLPIKGTCSSLALVSFNPYQEICVSPLHNSSVTSC